MTTVVGVEGADATSASLPTGWQAGDLAVALAFKTDAATTPSLPSGWTDLGGDAGSTSGRRAGFRILQSGDTDTGTWTNATQVEVIVLRGYFAIGHFAITATGSTTMNFPALTLRLADGTSWVIALGGSRNATDANSVALAGTTNRSPSQSNMALHTAEGVSSWPITAKTVNGSLANRTASVEVLDRLDGAPWVEDSAAFVNTSSATSNNVPLPGVVSAGSILIAVARCSVGGAIGWPGDWTELKDESPDASPDQTAIAYKVAAGTEGGTTIAVTHGSGKLSALTFSIAGGDVPQVSDAAVGTGTAADSPDFTPSGGSKKYLWMTVAASDGEATGFPAVAGYPAGYPLRGAPCIVAQTGTGGTSDTNMTLQMTARQAEAASENPGAWAITAAGVTGWTAYTIAVPPAAAPPAAGFTPRAVLI